ncbi:MAG: tRNA uridine-5-carboxymethylaminomethyl(34) synthesis GTPase MnmE [Salinarimonadaceae bacterium]|nr:MAG: tRNA uridine-5-carboxymethylaminomethyl(34) synthesis GTPase MnmE [Salinarimonadaceae bacterium]
MSELLSSPDTIYAPASGFGRAAVCVVRISGPRASDILVRMAGGAPEPRRMSLRRLVDPRDGDILDHALVVWLPAPHSFTGEDQAELQIHGGLAVRQAVLSALSAIEDCRPAEPGEFTRRALLAGRMDLTAAEGLADLVDAETEGQRRQALRQLGGGLGALADEWRSELIRVQALLEAALDFADEGDVPESLEEEARAAAIRLGAAIEGLLAEGRRGERLREGFHVVLAGPPNAGKSTLLNALARRDVAIVSSVPGTTRDIIETRCDLDGLPVIFADTAGLRETAESVEQQGVARARGRIDQADLVLWLDPADDRAPPPDGLARRLHVVTKIDLAGDREFPEADAAICAVSGDGLPALLETLASAARAAMGAGDALVTRERHRVALEAALAGVSRGVSLSETELFAEEIRLAARALGRVSGRVDVEDVLDQLFSSFCIGK